MLDVVTEHLRGEAAKLCESGLAPGFLAGVYQSGEQTVVAHGVANIVTGDEMTEGTGFLVGSIAKVMTATLMLQCAERRQVDLDERVTAYLPELALAPPANLEELRVRHLLNHTNGIDADLFWPSRVEGGDALRYMIEELRHCSTLFDPGEYVSYSNGGMLVAGRVLETVTSNSYHDLLERELYAPAGMVDSHNSAEQAILRRTAVGHFLDPETQALRRTDMFRLPESWSACGATQICTIADLLSLGRTHIADGVAPTGTRVISAESAARMRSVTADMGSPNVLQMGLGWPMLPFGDTAVLTHGGGSPGGVATLMVVPEHDLVFAAFGNCAGAAQLVDQLCEWLLGDRLGLDSPDVVSGEIEPADLNPYVGTYRSNQLRVDVRAVDGQLEETVSYEPFDDEQARTFEGFAAGQFPLPPYRLVAVGDALFAPVGVPLEAFNGFGRAQLISFHGGNGRAEYHSFGGRMARRDDEAGA